ncbi:MAG: hypothetical protein U0703_13325 [Anaerolineae bacterium]
MRATVVPVLIRCFICAEIKLLLEVCGFEIDRRCSAISTITRSDGAPRADPGGEVKVRMVEPP